PPASPDQRGCVIWIPEFATQVLPENPVALALIIFQFFHCCHFGKIRRAIILRFRDLSGFYRLSLLRRWCRFPSLPRAGCRSSRRDRYGSSVSAITHHSTG